jgi:hypothetical protein
MDVDGWMSAAGGSGRGWMVLMGAAYMRSPRDVRSARGHDGESTIWQASQLHSTPRIECETVKTVERKTERTRLERALGVDVGDGGLDVAATNGAAHLEPGLLRRGSWVVIGGGRHGPISRDETSRGRGGKGRAEEAGLFLAVSRRR